MLSPDRLQLKCALALVAFTLLTCCLSSRCSAACCAGLLRAHIDASEASDLRSRRPRVESELRVWEELE